MPLSIVVLISGTGSNLRAVQESISRGDCDAKISAVVSDRSDAPGLQFARQQGIPTSTVARSGYSKRAEWDAALSEEVALFQPAVVVLAGFMRIVGAAFLARFEHRIINVHPALLPLFPGIDGPAQAVAAGVSVSGCTVHLVDAGVDTGPCLAQGVVRVLPSDTATTLHNRIQNAEHQLLPRVIDAIARGRIKLGPHPKVNGTEAQDCEVFCSLPDNLESN